MGKVNENPYHISMHYTHNQWLLSCWLVKHSFFLTWAAV